MPDDRSGFSHHCRRCMECGWGYADMPEAVISCCMLYALALPRLPLSPPLHHGWVRPGGLAVSRERGHGHGFIPAGLTGSGRGNQRCHDSLSFALPSTAVIEPLGIQRLTQAHTSLGDTGTPLPPLSTLELQRRS
ncbi:hypothetical protein VaNZ11_014324 [Volvox africanus]|uniref:Uncharacterized protein n=1 Tax=Volvox africanus TaxID=51714 RepID=A0ABQ5SJJ9_9CHLO|nr:hypothetical protein VaNZ11_014324 [Volvox africanus]